MSDGLPRAITLDITGHRAVDPTSSERVLKDRVAYGTQVIYQAQVNTYPEGGSPAAAVLTGYDFRFVVDGTYGTHADLVLTEDEDFNDSGDWASVDLAKGKVCWPADFHTVPMRDALGVSPKKPMRAELWCLKPGATKWSLLAAWEIEVENSVGAVVGDPDPAAVATYVTQGELNGRLGAGVVLSATEDGRLSIVVNGVERGPI
jgi:hypothetical protein